MAGYASPGSDNLEDRLRNMILINDGPDTKPRVRLPNFAQQAPSPQPLGHHNQSRQNGSRNHQQSYAPSMALNGPPPAPRQVVPPHTQKRGHQQQPPAPYGPPHRMQHSRADFQGPVGRQRGRGRGSGMSRQQGRYQQQIPLDPNAFNRGGAGQQQGLFDPNARSHQFQYSRDENRDRQAHYLEQLAATEVPNVDMSHPERIEKESFHQALDRVCREVCAENPNLPKVSLECFGSFQSGFASAGSDMDLVIVVQDQTSSAACFSLLEDDLPRSLERKLLDCGYGARLLTRTRVPIIKVCQTPGPSFLDKLREEREKWDFLPNEKKYPHLFQNDEEGGEDDLVQTVEGAQPAKKAATHVVTPDSTTVSVEATTTSVSSMPKQNGDTDQPVVSQQTMEVKVAANADSQRVFSRRREQDRTWTRERKAGPLDFPKDGVGIQCDINFFNPLGLHNTQMLRCYSMCDPRVRPMVLFVKSWAKQRKINSSYSGTLSSYGYVLMVLHYLVNVAKPPVLPNLQSPWRPNNDYTPHGFSKTKVDEWEVDFWRNEEEIQAAVRSGQMSSNQQSLGALLADFFQYYSSMGNGPQFVWTQWVLSLRNKGGILTKDEKGWVKAITQEGEGKKIQHRYLFCIEDPFELSHNVARTVTHNGIVAIRDEFRRAFRILSTIGHGMPSKEGELFDRLVEAQDDIDATAAMKISSDGVQTGPAGSEQQSAPARSKKQAQPLHQRILDGAANKSSAQPPKASINGRKTQTKSIDFSDQEAFPSLGTASATKNNDLAEISGARAQAYLEEFHRKKAEAQAESTATGAAEAVLDGID